eukprot:scaffold279605_cov15-Tisochrysis_lutea.AAC.1
MPRAFYSPHKSILSSVTHSGISALISLLIPLKTIDRLAQKLDISDPKQWHQEQQSEPQYHLIR